MSHTGDEFWLPNAFVLSSFFTLAVVARGSRNIELAKTFGGRGEGKVIVYKKYIYLSNNVNEIFSIDTIEK